MHLKDFFRKADIFLAAGLVLLGVLSVFAAKWFSTGGDSVSVTVNGALYGTYPLSEDAVISVETEFGRNVIRIENGRVFVAESDCANHDCEHFGSIGGPGEVIMCLPHRLVITVSGDSGVDAVVY